MPSLSSAFQSPYPHDIHRLFEALMAEGDGLLFQCATRAEISGLTAALSYYYDRASQQGCRSSFELVDSAQHQAEGAGMFYVLHVNLSGIDNRHPTETIRQRLMTAFDDFFARYPITGRNNLSAEFAAKSSPTDLLLQFFNVVQPVIQRRLYILIEGDELPGKTTSDHQRPNCIPQRQTVALAAFLAQLKRNTNGSDAVARIFMVGIPRVFSQTMTEVFTLVKDISSFPAFTNLASLACEPFSQSVFLRGNTSSAVS